MGLSIAFFAALIVWLLLWAIGLQSLLSFSIAAVVALAAIAVLRSLRYVPANRPPR